MILKVGNRKIDLYNQVRVSLVYDSVTSGFSFDLYFDPENSDHKYIFKPGSYHPVTIEHDNELLITGTLLVNGFKSTSVRELCSLSGYSKTGVLEDCEIPLTLYPLQSNKLTLKEIAEKLAKPFGIKVVVDASIAKKADEQLPVTTASDSQSINGYLTEIATQKHLMFSHDENGNLRITEARATMPPIFEFGAPGTFVSMDLNFDGQQMHNELTAQKQATKGGKGNAGQASTTNPYCKPFRPKTSRQTSGRTVDTGNAARTLLSEELKAMTLKIEIDRWVLNGKVVRPNNIVTVINPDLYLYKKTKWFIQSVDFSGDNNSETAVLNCCLPEVFSNTTPENIFDL